MNPAIHDAYAAAVRRDRERASRGAYIEFVHASGLQRGHRHGARERLGRALIAAGSRLAH